MGMQQKLLTTSMITNEATRLLSNNLVLAKSVNRDYDSDFGVKGAKTGQTINIRRPIRPHGRVGPVIDPNAVVESYTPLTFAGPIGVDYTFDSTEMKLSVDQFSNRFARPAMVTLGNQIEQQGFNTLLSGSGNTIGTPGVALTAASAAQAVLDAAAILYDNGAPIGDMNLTEINSPAFNALLSGNNQKLFNPQAEIGKIYRRGMMGEYGGADHVVSQLVSRHTNGTFAGTPLVNGAGQSGSSLVTDGWSAGDSLNPGDSFTIAGVNAVNMATYTDLGRLQQFTVTAKSVTAAGASVLSISPEINAGPGGNQNVTAVPADNAAITILGTTGQSFSQAIMFHKDALMMASVELDLPRGVVDASYQRDPETGVGVRVVQDYDVRTDQWITRFDSMTTWGILFPQLIVRILGA